MDIAGEAFISTAVLVADAAAMTASAGAAHRRRLDVSMAFQQPATHRRGLADVALPARGVTAVAVVGLHVFQNRVIVWKATAVQSRVVARQRDVQAVLVRLLNRLVAGSTHIGGGLRGVLNQILVRLLQLGAATIALMTIGTGD